MVLKIAHFSALTPHGSGLYESTRELIIAENQIGGLDAGLINTFDLNGGMEDRGLVSKSWDWAENADVFVMHSHIPQFLEQNKDIPVVMILHGTPEDCLFSEIYIKEQFPYSTLLMYRKKKNFKIFVSMWERDLDFWKPIFPDVRYVPSGVDLERYKPEGPTAPLIGEPAIAFCDTWRNFKLPFASAYGVRIYYDKNKDMKFHIYDAPTDKKQNIFWRTLFGASGFKPFVGDFTGKHQHIEVVYRGADIIVTGVHSGPSRIIREATACGTTVVAAGVPELEFNAHPNRPSEYAEQIEKCWKWIQETGKENVIKENRAKAEKYFDIKNTARGMKKIYEEAVEKYGRK